MSRVLLCAALLGLGACEPASPDISPSDSTLDGAWRVRVVPVSHGCPEAGTLVPFRSGHLRIEEDGATLELIQPGADPITLTRAGAGEWGTASTEVIEGCRVDGEQWWALGSAGVTSLSATWSGSWELQGDCDLPIDACDVTYAVQGVR